MAPLSSKLQTKPTTYEDYNIVLSTCREIFFMYPSLNNPRGETVQSAKWQKHWVKWFREHSVCCHESYFRGK